MCVAVPARIVSIEGDGVGREALVEASGGVRRVSLMTLANAAVGDWVVTHSGFAIAKVGRKPAERTMRDLGGAG